MPHRRRTCEFYARVMKLIFLASAFLFVLPASGSWLHGENGLSPHNVHVMTSAYPQAAYAASNRLRLTRDLVGPMSTRGLTDAVPSLVQAFLNWFKDHAENTQCSRDLYDFVAALREFQPWALEIIDAWGKIGNGIMQGNVIWDGDYDQCIRITATPYANEKYQRTYKTQYCWGLFSIKALPAHFFPTNSALQESMLLSAVINGSMFYPVRSAMCLPDSCTEEQINDIVDHILPSLPAGKYLTYRGTACVPDDPSIWDDTGAVIAFAICCIIGVFLLLGTLYDILQRNLKASEFVYSKLPNSELCINTEYQKESLSNGLLRDAKLDEIDITATISMPQENGVRKLAGVKKKQRKIGDLFLAFSIYTNASKILSLKTSPDAIPVINGLRFISMTWVILGHTFVMTFTNFNNPVVIFNIYTTFIFHIIKNATFATDTFFLLSGLLTAYICLAGYEKTNGKFSWVQYYVHRFWRLTPPYILFIYVVQMKLSKYFSNGPYWELDGFSAGCDEYWWQNILYINNFNTITNMCMGWTWYMANDMQFFVLSPILLIPMINRWVKTTCAIAGGLILASVTCIGTLVTHYGLRMFIDISEVEPDVRKYTDIFDKVYTKPYTRMAPYVIGLMAGWLVYEYRTAKLKKWCVIAGWVATVVAGTGIVFCTYHAHMPQELESFYHAMSKVIWPLCICWLIYACANGNGGIIHTILSYPIWNPFSRLTYMAYLWHYLALLMMCAGLNTLTKFSYTYVFFYFVAMTFVSYVGAFVLTLAIESPFMALEKFVFGR